MDVRSLTAVLIVAAVVAKKVWKRRSENLSLAERVRRQEIRRDDDYGGCATTDLDPAR